MKKKTVLSIFFFVALFAVSFIAQEIIASSEFKKIYDACFEDFVNSDSDYSVYSDTLYYTIKSNKDLWFAIGQCACVMSFTKVTYSWPWDTCIKYRAEIGIHDIYDFDKREVKDIGDFLNNVAAGLQDRGILYPYSWEINFVKEETWWCV